MSRNDVGPVGLDRLEAALDTYGADRTRWPAPMRLALSGFIAGSPEAQKMLRDAEAFDRLLDSAPRYDVARLDKLSERIVAAAERQPRIVSSGSVAAQGARSTWTSIRRHHGITGAALAASLVLGVFAGQLNMFTSTADVLLGDDNATPTYSRQVALTDDSDSIVDEDFL